MRKRPRVDANQQEIVDMLRQVGCTVTSLASVGGGVPDLLVGYRGRTILMEVKDGKKPPSARLLTPDQRQWADAWSGGPVWVISDQTQALDIIKQIDS
jgi:hypothetical protein